jgi:hypothetical protein
VQGFDETRRFKVVSKTLKNPDINLYRRSRVEAPNQARFQALRVTTGSNLD